MASQLRQITTTTKSVVLAWIGIVGTAITLFGNLSTVLDMADSVRKFVVHWHEWNELFWEWVFSLVKLKVPTELVPVISFIVFTAMLVVGTNLAERTTRESAQLDHHTRVGVKLRRFGAGVLIYLVTFVLVLVAGWVIEVLLPEGDVTAAVLLVLSTILG
jgi:hypothetical protein